MVARAARRERQYAWQTGQGIFSGKMSLATSKSSRGKKSADVVKDQKLVMYPDSGHEAGDVPLSIGVRGPGPLSLSLSLS
eukprot:COSAG01_NODE_13908_length_1518_cov_89.702607_4_plen_79_part_01